MTLSEKAAYLKGLMDGIKLDTEKDENRLLKAVVDLLQDMAVSIDDLEDNAIAVSDELDEIEENLDAIDEFLMDYDEDDEDDYDDFDDEDFDYDLGDDDFDFPVVPERILNALCRAGFGIAVATLLFTLCAATPLRTVTRRNGSGFQAIAHAALFKFTVVGDALTRFRPAVPRSERLNDLWFAPPAPENASPADAPPKDSRQKTEKPQKPGK